MPQLIRSCCDGCGPLPDHLLPDGEPRLEAGNLEKEDRGGVGDRAPRVHSSAVRLHLGNGDGGAASLRRAT